MAQDFSKSDQNDLKKEEKKTKKGRTDEVAIQERDMPEDDDTIALDTEGNTIHPSLLHKKKEKWR